jgi:Right handed beta helix region
MKMTETTMKSLILASAFVVGFSVSSEAQIARVFVSVNGNDANDCLQPSTACRTLNEGVNKVDLGGEVILVDTGSYAGATITKSVKINVPSGNVAFSGLPIIVNAPNGTVVLRGLTLKALTPNTGTGIDIQAATAVFVENCVIDGWNTGVSMQVAGQLFVKASTIRNNFFVGVYVNDAAAEVGVDGSRMERNQIGLFLVNGKGGVVRSLFAQNELGAAVGGSGTLAIDQSEASNNSSAGFYTEGLGTIRVLNSTATANATGFRKLGGASVFESFGNNVVRGNTTNMDPGVVTVARQ